MRLSSIHYCVIVIKPNQNLKAFTLKLVYSVAHMRGNKLHNSRRKIRVQPQKVLNKPEIYEVENTICAVN